MQPARAIGLSAVLAIFAVTAGTARASGTTGTPFDQAVTACAIPVQGFRQLVAKLKHGGWEMPAPMSLNDSQIVSLALSNLGTQIFSPSEPAARWKSVWDIHKRAAATIRTRAPVNGPYVFEGVLTQSQSVIDVRWQGNTGGPTRTTCYIVTPAAGQPALARLIDTEAKARHLPTAPAAQGALALDDPSLALSPQGRRTIVGWKWDVAMLGKLTGDAGLGPTAAPQLVINIQTTLAPPKVTQ